MRKREKSRINNEKFTCDLREYLMESRLAERHGTSADSYFGYDARLLHRINLVLF